MTEDSDQSVKENKENSRSDVSVSGSRSKISPNKTNSAQTITQKKDKSREIQPTRVVIRHLPPSMTSEEFLEAISPVPEHNDYYFCRADTSLGSFGFCRAYINFLHMEDLFVFKDKFDGYVFVDTKGNEFVAIVEFAPYQRILRRRFGGNGQPISAKKRDNKSGTIEQDSDYTQFLEDLEKIKSESNLPSADVYLEEIEARDKQLKANHGCVKVTTPLIEFIKNRKLEKNRLREERREERKRQQSEQKRIREEEQQKKLKLLKSDDKITKDSDQRGREKSGKSEDERQKHKSKDLDKKSRPSKSSDNKRTDGKKSEKKPNPYRSEKQKDSKDSQKESKSKESTFVVKVVPNTDQKKSETNTSDVSDVSDVKSANNKEVSVEQNNKSDDSKGDKSESSSKNTNESFKSDSKRIRNKDRPTREIYRPGATKRGGQSEGSQSQSSAQKTGANKGEQNSAGYKERVFTRSKH